MTLDDVDRLFRYWKTYPPLYDLVAGFVGFKPPARTSEQPAAHPSIALIKALHPDGLVRG